MEFRADVLFRRGVSLAPLWSTAAVAEPLAELADGREGLLRIQTLRATKLRPVRLAQVEDQNEDEHSRCECGDPQRSWRTVSS